MADEGGMANFHASKDSEDSIINPKSILFKVGELVLSFIVIGLIIYPLDSFYQIFLHQPKLQLFDVALIYVTIAGFIIINAIFILSFFLGDRMPRVTSLLFTAVGTILHIIAGAIMVSNWKKLNGSYAYIYNNHTFGSKLYMDMLMAGAVFTFIDAIVFGVDVFFTIKYF